MTKRSVAAVVLLLLGGCVRTVPYEGAEPSVQGPPEVQLDVVRQHALQFDVDVPDRPPGSQHELAAASYILGHLQLAGYAPRLDRVPVADTVSSTNVVAFPPGGAEPEFLVTVAYDTHPSGREQNGPEIGLFLELARALTVDEPDHAVGFIALGAESVDGRGSKRLARFLLDEGIDPSIIQIEDPPYGGRDVYIDGACARRTNNGSLSFSSFTDGACRFIDTRNSVLMAAGFELTRIHGDVEGVARALTAFLMGTRS